MFFYLLFNGGKLSAACGCEWPVFKTKEAGHPGQPQL